MAVAFDERAVVVGAGPIEEREAQLFGVAEAAVEFRRSAPEKRAGLDDHLDTKSSLPTFAFGIGASGSASVATD